jgi:hypothetical protein
MEIENNFLFWLFLSSFVSKIYYSNFSVLLTKLIERTGLGVRSRADNGQQRGEKHQSM